MKSLLIDDEQNAGIVLPHLQSIGASLLHDAVHWSKSSRRRRNSRGFCVCGSRLRCIRFAVVAGMGAVDRLDEQRGQGVHIVELEVLDEQLHVAAPGIDVAQSQMMARQPVQQKDLQVGVIIETQRIVRRLAVLAARQLFVNVQNEASGLRNVQLLAYVVQGLQQRMHMQRHLQHLRQIVQAQLLPAEAQFAQCLACIDDAQRLDEMAAPIGRIRARILAQEIAMPLVRSSHQRQQLLQYVCGQGVLIAKEQER